jgi:L-asparagine transporter-like permease
MAPMIFALIILFFVSRYFIFKTDHSSKHLAHFATVHATNAFLANGRHSLVVCWKSE